MNFELRDTFFRNIGGFSLGYTLYMITGNTPEEEVKYHFVLNHYISSYATPLIEKKNTVTGDYYYSTHTYSYKELFREFDDFSRSGVDVQLNAAARRLFLIEKQNNLKKYDIINIKEYF